MQHHFPHSQKQTPDHTVALVGCGAVGTAFLHHLLEALAIRPGAGSVKILVFEKGPAAGPGLAYQPDRTPHLLNRTADAMSAVFGCLDHFRRWLVQKGTLRSDDPTQELYLPRQVFGEYLKDLFRSAVRVAGAVGVRVKISSSEIVSVRQRPTAGYQVATRDGAVLRADSVVLCLGNVPARRFPELRAAPGFIPSPYPSSRLDRIPPNATVGVLGTRLSAIDAVLALTSRSHQGPIILASRDGLLPSLRAPRADYTLEHATPTALGVLTGQGRRKLPLAAVLPLVGRELGIPDLGSWGWQALRARKADPVAFLRAELAEVSRGPRRWQDAGVALNEVIESLWGCLDDPSRHELLDRYHGLLMSYRVAVPRSTGETLLRLLEADRVSVEGGLRHVRREAGRFTLGFANGRTVRTDVLIDATGPARYAHEYDSPLVQGLLRDRFAVADPFGGLRVDFSSSRLLGADGGLLPRVYAIGQLTFGTFLFTSTLERNVRKAYEVAIQIARDVRRRAPPVGWERLATLGSTTPV